MLKSKILTLFIAFALIITVGGVYATWTYAGSNLTDIVAPNSLTITASINQAQVSGAPGSLEITTNDLAYHIANDNSYNTVLEESGSIVVEYTPNEGSEYQTVTLVCTITLTNTQYNSKNIFKFEDSVETVIEFSQTNVGNGASAWTIDNDDIGLVLTEAFNLNTVVKYNAFAQALQGSHLEIDINVDPNSPKTVNN